MANTVQYGYCTNKMRCTLAQNHEKVFVPTDNRCPECGQPLQVDSMARHTFKFLPILITLVVLGVIGYYVKTKYFDMGHNAGGPTVITDNPPANTKETIADTNNGGGASQGGGVVDKPKFNLEDDANAKARRDVLARIDLMPHLSEQQKSKLTTSVDRARGMGCIFIVPFDTGKKALGSRESDILVKGFQSASITKLMEDPTLVFVVLGYADKGDAQGEPDSISRAQSVLGIMKDRCNVQNVMYSVGMGNSTMFDPKQGPKNRLVEVWAVYP